jgi:uncharacterized membrane protein YfhO
MEMIRNFQIPLWNPYNFSGTPLLGNFQSAVFNPINFLLVVLPFYWGWGLQVFLQVFLAGIFMYFWLNNLRLDRISCLFGSLTFVFSGFFVSWLEWNTLLQTGMYLPLILLAKDKIIDLICSCKQNALWFINRKIFFWFFVLIMAETFSFFSGHLQTFFYVILLSVIYLLAKLIFLKSHLYKINKHIQLFSAAGILVFLLCSIQLFPTIEFIFNSARSFDQPTGFRNDWFLPWQHLIQLLAPDFFGNPATLNYFGVWNYGEFVSYVGIIPLMLAIIAIVCIRDKKTIFFTAVCFLSFVFALPNFISYLPYKLGIPFVSTTQPSRLLFISDFSLAVLAAFGFDYLLKAKKYKFLLIISFIFFLLYTCLWTVYPKLIAEEVNVLIAKRNLYLPIFVLAAGSVISLLIVYSNTHKYKHVKLLAVLLLLFVLVFDLMRFGLKFNTFSKKEWLFPSTAALEFLKKQEKPFRILSLDSRILPPNFSLLYHLETIEGYDPLYILRYGEYWAAVKRNRPDISSFNFNRIITPQIYSSPFIDILNVKYIFSLSELNQPDLKLVFTEGQTRVYQNLNAFPRVFMVGNVILTKNKQDVVEKLFEFKDKLDRYAIIEGVDYPWISEGGDRAAAEIIKYEAQKVVVKTKSDKEKFLVLGDIYYPGWKASIDGKKTRILPTDFILRGIFVPAGDHTVEFSYEPKSFYLGLATSILGMVIIFIWGISAWIQKK